MLAALAAGNHAAAESVLTTVDPALAHTGKLQLELDAVRKMVHLMKRSEKNQRDAQQARAENAAIKAKLGALQSASDRESLAAKRAVTAAAERQAELQASLDAARARADGRGFRRMEAQARGDHPVAHAALVHHLEQRQAAHLPLRAAEHLLRDARPAVAARPALLQLVPRQRR